MIFVLAFIFYFIAGSCLGCSIAFLIFSCVLDRSNNIGSRQKRGMEIPVTHNCVIISRADKIKRRPEIFEGFITTNMQNIIASTPYRHAMASAIKKGDEEEVTHENM